MANLLYPEHIWEILLESDWNTISWIRIWNNLPKALKQHIDWTSKIVLFTIEPDSNLLWDLKDWYGNTLWDWELLSKEQVNELLRAYNYKKSLIGNETWLYNLEDPTESIDSTILVWSISFDTIDWKVFSLVRRWSDFNISDRFTDINSPEVLELVLKTSSWVVSHLVFKDEITESWAKLTKI